MFTLIVILQKGVGVGGRPYRTTHKFTPHVDFRTSHPNTQTSCGYSAPQIRQVWQTTPNSKIGCLQDPCSCDKVKTMSAKRPVTFTRTGTHQRNPIAERAISSSRKQQLRQNVNREDGHRLRKARLRLFSPDPPTQFTSHTKKSLNIPSRPRDGGRGQLLLTMLPPVTLFIAFLTTWPLKQHFPSPLLISTWSLKSFTPSVPNSHGHHNFLHYLSSLTTCSLPIRKQPATLFRWTDSSHSTHLPPTSEISTTYSTWRW